MEKPVTPVLLGIDPESWDNQLDNVEKWFEQLQLIQASFRQFAEQTAEKIKEEHIKAEVLSIAKKAKVHEQKIGELYEAIGRATSSTSKMAGELAGKLNSPLADLKGLLGGAHGYWKDLHQLMILNLNALSAFAMAEQLGLALGIMEIPEIVFPILNEKQKNHLLLQEYSLETGAVAVLYNKDFG
ncbi:hypothetical protein [Planococcus lenghuensis]|nr:hypothetical protein [Planococcus lenghuensis]